MYKAIVLALCSYYMATTFDFLYAFLSTGGDRTIANSTAMAEKKLNWRREVIFSGTFPSVNQLSSQ